LILPLRDGRPTSGQDFAPSSHLISFCSCVRGGPSLFLRKPSLLLCPGDGARVREFFSPLRVVFSVRNLKSGLNQAVDKLQDRLACTSHFRFPHSRIIRSASPHGGWCHASLLEIFFLPPCSFCPSLISFSLFLSPGCLEVPSWTLSGRIFWRFSSSEPTFCLRHHVPFLSRFSFTGKVDLMLIALPSLLTLPFCSLCPKNPRN